MYEIRPESISQFLTDNTVKFPRFQRKQTWKADQNFKLAISIFKTYPVGVTIINKEDFANKSTRWLLDGRQRRSALKQMKENPENLYDWAKKFLKIKGSDTPLEIEEKFWGEIHEYLNYNEEDEDLEKKSDFSADEAQQEEFEFDLPDEGIEESDAADDSAVEPEEKNMGYLRDLLKIITTVHKRTSKGTGFTLPFDFSNIIKNLPYVENSEGKLVMSGSELAEFLRGYKNFVVGNKIEENRDSLHAYYVKQFKPSDKEQVILKNTIDQKWSHIQKSLEAVELVDNRLNEARIGVIETNNISATDSQMIFKLINDEGTKLSAVEILSAKPAWNIVVKNPAASIFPRTKELYSEIATENSGSIVRWDYPATFHERLENLDFVFTKLNYKDSLDKKITLGFKIISGIYQDGIKKEDVSDLATNKGIEWSQDIDLLATRLSNIGKILGEHSYFQYLKSYGKSLQDITSDAVALNFCLLVYRDFLRKGEPMGNNKNNRQFLNNAVTLADKLVLEYVTKKWRGSSDSKISQNIKAFKALKDDEQVLAAKEDEWKDVMKSVNDNFKIGDDEISFEITKSITYHVYAVNQVQGAVNLEYNVDHIIPQALFDTSEIGNKVNKDALFNLCPLPKKENAAKSDKRLVEIQNQWLKDEISKMSGIEQGDFEKYSSITNWEELRNERRAFYEKTFIEERSKRLCGE